VGIACFVAHQFLEKLPSDFRIAKLWMYFQKAQTEAALPKLDAVAVGEPADVAAERAKAIQDASAAQWQFPLSSAGITKEFDTMRTNRKKVAVDNLALAVNPVECFGLLGPNGGGKTTLVNVLSGLYTASSGDAMVKGNSVVTGTASAQRHLGVCPQECVLWGELSAREHLLLFGKLRNLDGEQLEAAVELTLKQVLLTDAANRPSKGYSGGMKRRLSLAIALIGCPSVILLDEPTTGVDPFSRRVVWDTILAYKRHCTIVLITHNMEEADALCDRVGMVNNGKIVCVGHPNELKARYGVGYTLSVLHNLQNSTEVMRFISQVAPESKLVNLLPGSCIFSIPKNSIKLSNLFASFHTKSTELGIVDWAILPSNLEDVLLKSTEDAN